MTPHLAARATRRGVVGGLVLGVTATACELDPPRDDPANTGPGPTDGSSAGTDDPDARLVRRVAAELGAALAVADGVGRARPPLTREVAPWRQMHRAHLEALERGGRVRPEPLRGSATDLRARLRRQEARLQRQLADAALAARSGALASLLATMSAAVAQQLAAGDAGSAP